MAKGNCTACLIEGRERQAVRREWCAAHYKRWRRHGDPFGGGLPRSATPHERFWAKVNKDGPVPEHRPDLGPCWVWTGSLNSDGYGNFWTEAQRSCVNAHGWAWQQAVGPVRDGLELDHLCRHPGCVRPAHLEPVSHQENVRRGAAGDARRAQTHCIHGHPFDEANTYVTASGKRRCRMCERDRMRVKRARSG
jgi:hypothetical protein